MTQLSGLALAIFCLVGTPSQLFAEEQVSAAAQEDPEAVFEGIKNRVKQLSGKMIAVSNYTPTKLEEEETENWWADYFARVNGAKDVFSNLESEAQTTISSGSDQTRMSWWNDLKDIKTSVQTAIDDRTQALVDASEDPEQDFRLIKLNSAQQIIGNLENQVYSSIQSAISDLDKMKTNLVLKFEQAQTELAEARDEQKTTSKHTMRSEKGTERGASEQRNTQKTADRRAASRKASGQSAQAGRAGRQSSGRQGRSRGGGRSSGARRNVGRRR